MTDKITFGATTKERTRDGSALPVVVGFRTANVATAPTSIRYRVDDPDTGCEKVGWTTVSPASSATITITASANTCNSARPIERRELIVEADNGLSGAYVERFTYEVENIGAIY